MQAVPIERGGDPCPAQLPLRIARPFQAFDPVLELADQPHRAIVGLLSLTLEVFEERPDDCDQAAAPERGRHQRQEVGRRRSPARWPEVSSSSIG